MKQTTELTKENKDNKKNKNKKKQINESKLFLVVSKLFSFLF